MKQEIKFSEYSCRFHCPHFQSVGPILNETYYCMEKGKKGKRFLKKDLKRKPPEWCPLRLDPPVCRIYGLKDILGESMERDNRLSTDPDQVSWYFPMGHRYRFRMEVPLGKTAAQFYSAVKEEMVETVLGGVPVNTGELIEIDDGLSPVFFYVYNGATVLPAKVFGLKPDGKEDGRD